MSRSRKKTPVIGNCTGDSQKQWKQQANRRHRRKEREAVEQGEEPARVREVSDEWNGPYDGKRYRQEPGEHWERK